VAHGAPAPAPSPADPAPGSAEWIKGATIGSLGDDADRKTQLAGEMLISALLDGPNADAIAKRLKAPRKNCREIAARFRDNGIWIGQAMNIGEWAGEDGQDIVFVLHALTGAGYVVAVDSDGERKWQDGRTSSRNP
jgi:hypothetical protein